MAVSERKYGGASAHERVSRRRRQLLDAALEVVSSVGAERATMTAVCRSAGLSERYFYESFSGLDALMSDLLDELAAEVRAAVLDALSDDPDAAPEQQIRSAISAFIAIMTEDQRKGRVVLTESLGLAATREHRRAIVNEFAGLLAARIPEIFGDDAVPEQDRRPLALLLVGGIAELTAEWVSGGLNASPDRIVEVVTRQLALNRVG